MRSIRLVWSRHQPVNEGVPQVIGTELTTSSGMRKDDLCLRKSAKKPSNAFELLDIVRRDPIRRKVHHVVANLPHSIQVDNEGAAIDT